MTECGLGRERVNWRQRDQRTLIKIYITRQGTTEKSIKLKKSWKNGNKKKRTQDECDELFSLIFHILHDERRIEIFISSGDSRHRSSTISLSHSLDNPERTCFCGTSTRRKGKIINQKSTFSALWKINFFQLLTRAHSGILSYEIIGGDD